MATKNEQKGLFDVKDPVVETLPEAKLEDVVEETSEARSGTVFNTAWIAKSRINNGGIWIEVGDVVTDADLDPRDVPEWLELGILVPQDDEA